MPDRVAAPATALAGFSAVTTAAVPARPNTPVRIDLRSMAFSCINAGAAVLMPKPERYLNGHDCARDRRKKPEGQGSVRLSPLVELRGIEPLTSSLRTMRSPS